MGFKVLQDALEKAGISKAIPVQTKKAESTDRLESKKSGKKKKKNRKNFQARPKARRLPKGKIVVKKRAKPLPQPKAPESVIPKKNSVTITGPLSLHPLLKKDPTDKDHQRIHIKSKGLSQNISLAPQEEADLIIGLDFGTSSTKIVIRDVSLDKSFAVPFFSDKNEINNFLFPSHVFRTGNSYSLDEGEECFRDLKLRLIEARSDNDGAFNQAAIFLALLIRHSRGWLFDKFPGQYGKTEILWSLNLGLPARHYEDEDLVKLFKKLAWYAEHLSANGKDKLIDEDIKDAKAAWENNKLEETGIDVIPEIAAQIYGYIRSGHWDKGGNPMMMMVDIGAGTLDSAFFSVEQDDEDGLTYRFLGVEVQPFGVMNLHRGRVRWLLEILRQSNSNHEGEEEHIKNELTKISYPTDRLKAIPDEVKDYIDGVKLNIIDNHNFIDAEFKERNISPQINRCVHQAWSNNFYNDLQYRQFPIFLCGGGSRMHFYKQIADYQKSLNTKWKFRIKKLPQPGDLTTEESIEKNYDRLSVAYGLSWHMKDIMPIGKIVRNLDIPAGEPTQRLIKYEENYISKDMV